MAFTLKESTAFMIIHATPKKKAANCPVVRLIKLLTKTNCTVVSIYYFHQKKTKKKHSKGSQQHNHYTFTVLCQRNYKWWCTCIYVYTHTRTYTHTYAAVSFQNSNDSYYNHWRINNAAQILTNDTHFPPK